MSLVMPPIHETATRQAVRRLRGLAYANCCVLMAASWGLAYGLSTTYVGFPETGVLGMGLVGMAISAPSAFHAVMRLSQCTESRLSWPRWWSVFSQRWPFAPIPTLLVDDGACPASLTLEQWLVTLGNEHADVRRFADSLRNAEGELHRADAVNVRLFAQWHTQQIKQGCLNC